MTHGAVLYITPRTERLKRCEPRFVTYELLHPSTGQGILRVNHVGILDLVVRFSCFTVVCLPLPLASSAYWCSLLSEAFLRSHFHPITERVAHITFSLARDKHLEGFSPKLQEGSFSCQVNNYLLVMIFLGICCGIFREFKKGVEDESKTEQITLYSYSILNDFILGKVLQKRCSRIAKSFCI